MWSTNFKSAPSSSPSTAFQDIQNIAELERRTAKAQYHHQMLFGINSGKLRTGRRVQLVIWLQIMQEWIGIAGVTIYSPTIFRIAESHQRTHNGSPESILSPTCSQR